MRWRWPACCDDVHRNDLRRTRYLANWKMTLLPRQWQNWWYWPNWRISNYDSKATGISSNRCFPMKPLFAQNFIGLWKTCVFATGLFTCSSTIGTCRTNNSVCWCSTGIEMRNNNGFEQYSPAITSITIATGTGRMVSTGKARRMAHEGWNASAQRTCYWKKLLPGTLYVPDELAVYYIAYALDKISKESAILDKRLTVLRTNWRLMRERESVGVRGQLTIDHPFFHRWEQMTEGYAGSRAIGLLLSALIFCFRINFVDRDRLIGDLRLILRTTILVNVRPV